MQGDEHEIGLSAPAGPLALMTTAEVGDYLRVKERTIYDMVARGAIPFTRATGKLLFPRRLVDAWLETQTEVPREGLAPPPPIYAGSNDPLLEWALRQSGAGLAILASGSSHGLRELAAGRAMLAGCHLLDSESGDWNLPAVKANLPGGGHVVIHWARRTQGLLLAPGNPLGVTSLADAVTRGLRFALRPEGAGSRRLLDLMTAREGLSPDAIRVAERPAETHEDVADLVASGDAECGLGLEAAASGLAFVPLVADECFDLVMRRRDYFEPPIQALLAFTRTETFARRAVLTKGYDVSDLGRVRANG